MSKSAIVFGFDEGMPGGDKSVAFLGMHRPDGSYLAIAWLEGKDAELFEEAWMKHDTSRVPMSKEHSQLRRAEAVAKAIGSEFIPPNPIECERTPQSFLDDMKRRHPGLPASMFEDEGAHQAATFVISTDKPRR